MQTTVIINYGNIASFKLEADKTSRQTGSVGNIFTSPSKGYVRSQTFEFGKIPRCDVEIVWTRFCTMYDFPQLGRRHGV